MKSKKSEGDPAELHPKAKDPLPSSLLLEGNFMVECDEIEAE